jgi:hypothetical protein
MDLSIKQGLVQSFHYTPNLVRQKELSARKDFNMFKHASVSKAPAKNLDPIPDARGIG